MSRIAFIGLGNMGGPMAANLVKNGHSVRVFYLVPAAVQAAVDAGASAASSARDTLADAEVVISMLPASRHVEGVYLGDDGILAAIPAGALVIDCSTIAPASARSTCSKTMLLPSGDPCDHDTREPPRARRVTRARRRIDSRGAGCEGRPSDDTRNQMTRLPCGDRFLSRARSRRRARRGTRRRQACGPKGSRWLTRWRPRYETSSW